ncbi:MAG: hypothetical protein A3F74_09990 [Betaproteobacteria bacterium RIFCSPLOWO2_12_FULL_62_58]|nr:MAG: hypothetical protein A3F74_09990 [Betaproteobacteria bacterium RIFCSPLOWO2_12_FULL_62_58]
MLTRTLLHLAAGLCAAAMLGTSSRAHAAASWTPERNVEIIVPTSPGSSQDATARLMQNVLQGRKLVSVPITIVNRPGVVGTDYLLQRAGDGHYLYIGSAVVLTNHMTGKSAIDYIDLTAVAQLFGEYIACVVNANSAIKNGNELLERLKNDPASLSIAFATSRGNTNHVAIAQAAKAVGIDPKALKIVLFKSGGEAMTALLGGHVDVVSSAAGTVVDHLAVGRVRALAISSPQRMSGVLASVPTWRELGADSVASNWRNIFGPKGMTPEQIQYWEERVAHLVETDEWKRDLEKRFRANTFMRSSESRVFLHSEHKRLKDILADLGLAK